jgi:hypothetical protein
MGRFSASSNAAIINRKRKVNRANTTGNRMKFQELSKKSIQQGRIAL